MPPHLENYNGMQSRHKCPNCNDAHSFTYYVDDDGKMIDESCGICNHINKCGYHLSPKQFFAMHPERVAQRPMVIKPYTPPTPKPLCLIPFDYVVKSKSLRNDFVDFLLSVFDADKVRQVADMYLLGSSKDKRVIYWQIDKNGKVRTGKLIKYNANTGHRVKDVAGAINWVHSLLKKSNLLPVDWQLSQCLFGEHLLNDDADGNKIIALVEAEKTAIIGAIMYPQFIWMATGGIENLNADRLKALTGRTIVLYPDIDGVDVWAEKAKSITGCKIIISGIFQTGMATDEDKANKIDIADWMIKDAIKHKQEQEHPYSDNAVLQAMAKVNPEILTMIRVLNLKPIAI